MAKNKRYTLDFRVWFNSDEEKLLGKGRVELLERINKTGSILQAAEGMKMSYRQAWQMVKEINERAKSPLVEKQLGGKNGGGAIVTEEGKKAIEQFHKLENKVKAFIQKESKKIKF
jgi:molybdate transport system regulatory protein